MLQCNNALTRRRRHRAAIAGKQGTSLRMAAMLQCKIPAQIFTANENSRPEGRLFHGHDPEKWEPVFGRIVSDL
jgi:hypothetical protein